MRKISFLILFLSLILSSCVGIKVVQIGKLNMLSNRNVESSVKYDLLKNYMGGSEKELKKATAKSIEDAVDATVRNTPGGEFLKNVKVYLVQKKNGNFYAVEGDIWGVKSQQSFRGFKVGDMVQWNGQKGTITGLIDAEECMVKPEGSENSKKMKYEKLTKISE